MKILAPTTLRRHHRTTAERIEPARVPSFADVRETVAGPAAAFDWGSPLPPMSMTRIAALPEPEWARPAYSSRHGLPLGWLRTVDMVAVASSRATVAENLSAIAAELDGPAGTAAQMLLTAHVARLAVELAATVPVTVYDHRPIGVSVGRELGTENTTEATI